MQSRTNRTTHRVAGSLGFAEMDGFAQRVAPRQNPQQALRERFPSAPIIIATVVNGWRPAYLPTRETYGLGIYQEQVAVLAPGCLEAVIDTVSQQIAEWEPQP